MSSKKLVIIGGEGNGGVVAACVEEMSLKHGNGEWQILGFLNDFHKGTICGQSVLGPTMEVASLLKDEDIYFSFAVHPIEHGMVRVKLFEQLNIPDKRLATIIHPSAFVAPNAEIGPGCFIMANTYIGPQTVLEKSVYVMANCVIGHNDRIGRFCHISAGSTISSYVKIGEASDVCLAASVLEKVTIGSYCVIGANALLTKSTGDSELYIGSPARLHRTIELKEYELNEG
jgi:sugar O-acyltransferase (sialic acid O-acetyltransferase NeuD family)